MYNVCPLYDLLLGMNYSYLSWLEVYKLLSALFLCIRIVGNLCSCLISLYFSVYYGQRILFFKTKNIKNIVDINISKYFLYISGIRDKLYYFIYLNVVLIKVRITLMLNNYYKNSSESYYCFVKTLTALEQGMNFIWFWRMATSFLCVLLVLKLGYEYKVCKSS